MDTYSVLSRYNTFSMQQKLLDEECLPVTPWGVATLMRELNFKLCFSLTISVGSSSS